MPTTRELIDACQHFHDLAIQHKNIGMAVKATTLQAELVGINRNSATLFYHKIREMIAYELDDISPFSGEVEVDESYFGGVQKGQRGRGAAGKTPVFGILKRGGKVYTKVIPDASSDTLMPIIKHKVMPDSAVYSDSWGAYNTLDVSGFHHQRINGIENFWNQAK